MKISITVSVSKQNKIWFLKTNKFFFFKLIQYAIAVNKDVDTR